VSRREIEICIRAPGRSAVIGISASEVPRVGDYIWLNKPAADDLHLVVTRIIWWNSPDFIRQEPQPLQPEVWTRLATAEERVTDRKERAQ
jgi:hypothetical protein